MYIFDPHYDVEMKELISPEYNMNKSIDGQIIYVLKKHLVTFTMLFDTTVHSGFGSYTG